MGAWHVLFGDDGPGGAPGSSTSARTSRTRMSSVSALRDKVESNPKDHNVTGRHKASEEGIMIWVSSDYGSHDNDEGRARIVAHDGRNVNEFKGVNARRSSTTRHISRSTLRWDGS